MHLNIHLVLIYIFFKFCKKKCKLYIEQYDNLTGMHNYFQKFISVRRTTKQTMRMLTLIDMGLDLDMK